MARRRRKPIGEDLVDQIQDALDKGLKRLLVNTQSKLSQASPVDTGRLASSWMIGKDTPNTDTRPEDWAEPGDKRVEVVPYEGEIKASSRWWISNNLDYAARAAFDPGYVGRRGGGRGDWFTEIQNTLPKDAERSFSFFFRRIK